MAPAPCASRSGVHAFAPDRACRALSTDGAGRLWSGAVLINRKLECLYFQGPVDRYLKVVSGRPVNDLIAMAREGVRAKLRLAVQSALHENARSRDAGGRTNGDGRRHVHSASSSFRRRATAKTSCWSASSRSRSRASRPERQHCAAPTFPGRRARTGARGDKDRIAERPSQPRDLE